MADSGSPIALAPLPPMGWMSWNAFGYDLSEEVVLATADAMLQSGLCEAGYTYLCLDDCWQGGREPDGRLRAHQTRFPHGIAWLAGQLHGRGLKLGIYTCAGPLTCAGEAGSEGSEELDATTFAEWGVDYVKVDYCHAPPARSAALERYRRMGTALRSTGRPIVFAVCEWGKRAPWEWAASVGASQWRTSDDIQDRWGGTGGILDVAEQTEPLAAWAGPGHWNDPDMLVVGLRGRSRAGAAGTIGCSEAEYRSQLSLWAILAAPLFASCDLRQADATTLALLTAPGVLAIDQDRLGRPGRRVRRVGPLDVWHRELDGRAQAIAILNRSDDPVPLRVTWPSRHGAAPDVINTWSERPVERGGELLRLEPHATVLYRSTSSGVNPIIGLEPER
ncbi:MAG: glycoside hydrolase family 27 protein [Candidatus Limnocylindrales bacterium]